MDDKNVGKWIISKNLDMFSSVISQWDLSPLLIAQKASKSSPFSFAHSLGNLQFSPTHDCVSVM